MGVVRSEAGQPIPDAEVCVGELGQREDLVSTAVRAWDGCARTNSLGEFRLQTRARGTWVSAAAEGFATKLTKVSRTSSKPIDIVLLAGVALRGQVVDGVAGAIEGARVMAFRVGGDREPVAVVTSQSTGAFALGVSEGQYELYAHAPGYAAGYAGAFAPGHSVTLALAPESRIVGRVVDPTGAAVPEVVVRAESTNGLNGVQRASSGHDGEFTLSQLSGGAYTVRVESPQWRTTPLHVELGVAEHRDGVTLVAARAGAIEAQVLIEEEPCAAGEVVMEGPAVHGAEVQVGGTAAIGGLEPGRYVVTARCRGAQAMTVEVEVTSRPTPDKYVWRLDRGRSIRGAILSASGVPKAGLLVRVEAAGFSTQGAPPSSASSTSYQECSTNERGEFLCGGLDAGRYRCSIRRGERELYASHVTVPEHGNADLRVTLPPSGTIRISGAVGMDVVAEGRSLLHAQLEADGGSWLRDVALGTYSVRYSNAQDATPATVERDGQLVNVTLVAPPVERLAGRVTAVDEMPIPDAWVVARPHSGAELSTSAPSLRALTDDLGQFEFPSVPRGLYLVTVHSLHGTMTAAIRSGEAATLSVKDALLPTK